LEAIAVKHLLATVGYRCSKAIDLAPSAFSGFQYTEGAWTPIELLSHIADLFEYTAVKVIDQTEIKREKRSIDNWDFEVERFYRSLEQFDQRLTEKSPLDEVIVLKLIQGPLADALTHVGQLTMLRRAAGSPIDADNYFKANIKAGTYRY
jgi:hypothetical protein